MIYLFWALGMILGSIILMFILALLEHQEIIPDGSGNYIAVFIVEIFIMYVIADAFIDLDHEVDDLNNRIKTIEEGLLK